MPDHPAYPGASAGPHWQLSCPLPQLRSYPAGGVAVRALTYFRVSPSDADGHASGATALEQAFQDFCDAQGHTPHGVFSDDATGSERPRYREMVEHIRSSGLAYLVVLSDVAHLGDSLEDQVGRLLELDALDCRVVCDDSDAPDALQAVLRQWKSGSSTGSRRERIREGMRAKAARAMGLGKPPFGYRIGAEGTLVPVESEAKVVRTIYRLYLEQDLGVRSIARELNDSGQRTRRGESWSMVTIRDILRNHAYIGTYTRFGLRIPGSYHPLVSAEEFKAVQDRMRSRSPNRRHPRAEPFLLSGLLYCAQCGSRMMGVTRRQMWRLKSGDRVRREYRYYQCQSRTNRSQCQYHTWRAAELDDLVVDRLRRTAASAAGEPGVPAQEAMDRGRAQEQARLRSLERRYVECVQRAAQGSMTMRGLRSALEEVAKERQVVARRLAALGGSVAEFRQARQAHRRRLEGEWDGMDLAERQEVLHALLSRVTVADGSIDLVLEG